MVRRTLLVAMAVCLVVLIYRLVLYPLLAALIPLPPIPVSIFTMTMCLFSLLHASYALGWRQMLLFFVLSAVISWVFEQVGVETGIVYGPYYYTDVLGPKLGHVPFLIPLAWFMMIYPSYVIANLIVGDRSAGSGGNLLKIIWLAALSATVMTAWDLTMDPIMSGPGIRAWIWTQGGPYFGVPLQNFVGWFLTTFTVYLIYRLFERRTGLRPLADATPLIAGLAPLVYGLILVSDLLETGDPQALRIIAPFVMGLPLLIAVGNLLRKPELAGPQIQSSTETS